MRTSEPDPADRHDTAGAAPPADVIIVVHVVRSGGIAGLKREWTAEPQPTDAPRWMHLIDECPWEASDSAGPPRGADRFQWRISARCADEPARQASLSDDELEGPWRQLVEEVRSFGGTPRERAGR
ncbi:protealysin inhibitor emfourin [Microbacterium sp. RU33B]|uniref:protealysin inhibitor emfourin n=1 Tax=Microbacterium sp. RU33B TaxID=1907390 RepID=UPI00095D0376|nr:protealysin inhibitor emfourin [Microbacterium sp. RU33B]SIT89344.1 hypothetical protein SAMN05880545_3165 [Microbacterium sp. RU33B]